LSSIFLVTGGAGFIGSHIAERLVKKGHRVRVLDNFVSGKRENLRSILSDIELIEGDLRDIEAVKKAARGVEYIFHQGALGSVPRSIEDPASYFASNITGTLNLLQAARDAGVRRVVYASSSSVYGDSPALPKHEMMTPMPLSPYALTKLSAEQTCQVFTRVYGFETVSLRYFNVFGPRQDPNSEYAAVIPRFISLMLRGQQPIIFGDGQQTRDFTYIENVVDANLKAMYAEQASGEAINIACGKSLSLLELVSILNELLGARIEACHAPERQGDIKHSLADISKARQLLGYEPRIGIREGLSKTLDWHKGEG